jgi:hypothetical protein
VGTLTALTVTGTATSGNVSTGGFVSATGQITGSQFNGSGAGLTAIPAANVTGTLGVNTTGSAASLTTARAINGTNFNGTAAITTANWGTARNITIGSTTRSVNGSTTYSWSLADIGAAPATATVNLTGNQTISGVKSFDNKVQFSSATTHGGTINLPRLGTTNPASTVDGDLWYRSNNLFYNNNGVLRAVAHTGSWSLISEAAILAGTETTSRFISAARLRYAFNNVGGNIRLVNNNTSYRQNSTTTWSGNPGAGVGKIEYHSNRWYMVAGSDSNRIVQFRRDATDVAHIDNLGVYNGTATSARYADLAEIYSTDQDYPAGTVVVFGGVKEVTESATYADPKLAGVISTNPAHLMNSEAEGQPIALQGRVPCSVVGNIVKGDLITTSDTPGVGTRLDPEDWRPGTVLGKALESYNSEDPVVIEVVVGRV